MGNKKFIHSWVFQFLICLVIGTMVHLPYLLGTHLYFDGDEAVVGIMAQDLIAGKNIPIYFYGQQYGFSFFEVVAVAIGVLIFGNTVWALKMGALIIFSVGLSFLFRLCITKGIGFWITCAIILVISCFPAWLLWAAKPRGGYLTAYAVACILVYIFQCKPRTIKTIVASSLLLAIGIHAQVLLMLPVAVYYAGWIMQRKKVRIIVGSGLVLIVCLILVKLPAYLNEEVWKVPLAFKIRPKNLTVTISEMPRLVFGSYFYELTFPLAKKLAWIGGFFYFLSGLIIIRMFFKADPAIRFISIQLIIGGILSFLLISLMVGGVYRYTLGISTAFLMVLFLSLVEIARQKKRRSLFLIPMVLLGLSCAYLVKNVPSFWMRSEKNDMQMYTGLLEHLKKRKIEHIYILDPMMQWMFNYSGISSRSVSVKERIDRYATRVDRCYMDPACTVALVGFTGYFNYTDSLNDWNEKLTIVNDRFFIYENPEHRHLKAGGFE
jgi:hypothetical protein